MILIADSGTTKTDWLLINNSNNTFISTGGINAYYMSSEAIAGMLSNELVPYIPNKEILSVFYYGSGCSTKAKCEKIRVIIQEICPNAVIEVNHDMLAAARALCDTKPGIACILGTGSNSCVYDGHNITRQMVSLGYFFGDEGSGTHLGKLLITAYLRGELPAEISDKLNEEYNLSFEFVLDHIYNQATPNRFLSSFSPFIQKNCKHPYIQDLIAYSFNEFLKVGVFKFTGYEKMEVNFVGSVAYHYQDILMKVTQKNNIKIRQNTEISY